MLGLCCCTWAFSSYSEQGLLSSYSVWAHGPLSEGACRLIEKIDDIGITAEFVYLYAPYDYMLDIDFTNINTTNENKTCKNSLTYLSNLPNNLRTLGINADSTFNLGNYSHSQLVSLFTNSTNLNVSINNRPVESTQGLGNYEQDPTNGNIVNSGEYSEFVSTLVYDEGTADVAGVILVHPKNTN